VLSSGNSLAQPLVLIFEDLHWIDDQTHALLDLLADSVANARILLLFDYRPEYRHEWTNLSYYAQLRLDPLTGADGAAMLSPLLGDEDDLAPVKRLILERTGGNPFFIEEIVQALFDEGALVRNGNVKSTRPIAQLRLPPTVQGILAARIDRLPLTQKEVLRTLAIIGRRSPLTLLQRVVATDELQLSRSLVELRAGEFIYEQPAAADTHYVLKHALTQEVAYNSVLIERRKMLHERAAQAFEALFVDSIEEHLVDLCHHYGRSGNDSPAINYLIRAADQAEQRSAYSQAATFLEQALTRLNDQPAGSERDTREMAIHGRLGETAGALSGYAAPEYEYHVTRCHELAQRLGDTAQILIHWRICQLWLPFGWN
jgi:predicted ATPase